MTAMSAMSQTHMAVRMVCVLMLCVPATALLLRSPQPMVVEGSKLGSFTCKTPLAVEALEALLSPEQLAMVKLGEESNQLAATPRTLTQCAEEALLGADVPFPAVESLAKSSIPGVDYVFVVHHSSLTARRVTLEALLKEAGIVVNWLDRFDHERLPTESRTCLFGAHSSAHSGAAAGTWAHMALFARQQMHKWGNVMILEDDPQLLVPVGELRAKLAEGLGCAGKLPSGFDTFHVAPAATGFVVSAEGGRKMLSWLAKTVGTQPHVAPATDMMMAHELNGCVDFDPFKQMCPIGPHGEDMHTICEDWSHYNWQRHCMFRSCSKMRMFSLTRDLWANGGRASWYKMAVGTPAPKIASWRDKLAPGVLSIKAGHGFSEECSKIVSSGFTA